jgi:hypothetical protein
MIQEPVSWVEGEHAALIAAICAKKLDPAAPARWRWDPRPRRETGKSLPTTGEAPAACPFLVNDLPLLEAHAEWIMGGKSLRLLVVLSRKNKLRWLWHVTPAQVESAP